MKRFQAINDDYLHITAGKAVLYGALLLFLLGFFIFGYLEDHTQKKYYINEVFITKALVAETVFEDNAPAIRLDIAEQSENSPFIDSDRSWIQITPEFENKIMASSTFPAEVGARYASIEEQRLKYFGFFGNRGYITEGSYWTLDEVYDSYEAALAENPEKRYEGPAVLSKKKAFDNSRFYFVVESDNRKYSLKVDETTFNQFQEGAPLVCAFHAVGELVKVESVKTN